jgi:hypothetical protein
MNGNANFQYGYGYQFEKTTYQLVCNNRRVSCIKCQICFINTNINLSKIHIQWKTHPSHRIMILRYLSWLQYASCLIAWTSIRKVKGEGGPCYHSPPSQS